MPPYRATGLGGINGSGVYEPNTRPIIDIGGVINAASHAFSNTREGVLHRALLQQAANREEQQHQLRVAEAASQGILPLEAARRMIESGGMIDDEETPVAATTPAEVPAAPPPVDSSIEGAPTVGQLVAPAQGTAPPLKAKKAKYTMVDLGNGFAQIPELSPYAQKTAMLEQRLREMEDAIHLRGEEARTTEGTKQTGRETILGEKTAATTARDATKHGFDMEKQAAALAAHTAIARMRASMSSDPGAMKPTQRVALLGKLADTYVSAANGDPNHALEIAENDPTLSTFGTNAKQLQSFIAGSVGKWQRGELNTNLRTQGQTFESPEKTTERINATKKIVTAPAVQKESITQAEADGLKKLGHTQEDIDAHYVIKK